MLQITFPVVSSSSHQVLILKNWQLNEIESQYKIGQYRQKNEIYVYKFLYRLPKVTCWGSSSGFSHGYPRTKCPHKTNSTRNITGAFCIRIVDFWASTGLKYKISRGFTPGPIRGFTAPPNPPLFALSLCSAISSCCAALRNISRHIFWYPRPWLAPLLEVYARWDISSQSDPCV